MIKRRHIEAERIHVRDSLVEERVRTHRVHDVVGSFLHHVEWVVRNDLGVADLPHEIELGLNTEIERKTQLLGTIDGTLQHITATHRPRLATVMEGAKRHRHLGPVRHDHDAIQVGPRTNLVIGRRLTKTINRSARKQF